MNLRITAVLLGIGFGIGAGQAAAQTARTDSVGASELPQAKTTNTRLAETLPASYVDPDCFKGVSQRQVHQSIAAFKMAFESKTLEGRRPKLAEARRIVVDAIVKDNQSENAGAWYTLGQIDLYQDDVLSADTALKRARSLAPGCKHVVTELRSTAWIPLMNGGIELSRADVKDSALILFRKAALINPDSIHSFMNAGVLFANTSQPDSAIVYFQQVLKRIDTTKVSDERTRSTYNLAVMLHQTNRHAEAAGAFERYLQWMPDDNDAKGALASSYRASGQVEKAQELDKVLLATVAVSDSGATGGKNSSAKPVAASVAMRVGIDFFNEKKYTEAADAFRKVVEAEPLNRDAAYNLANTYSMLKDGPKLVQISKELIRIEPLNENVYHWLGTGYKLTENIDLAIKIAEQMLALPVDVTVKEFNPRGDGAKLKMAVLGRDPQTAAGKAIKAVPVTLAFEFLDASGTAVATQEAEVPSLKPEEQFELAIEGKGKGIAAWRYSRK